MRSIPFSHPLFLALLVFFGFIVNLGSVPLFDVDEGAFSEATREMLASGIWSATYLDGEPRYDKPILTYWVQAAFVQLFGLNEVGLRMHSVTSVLLWGTALFLFVRQFVDQKAAIVAVSLFSIALWITVMGRAATADALLNLFIALSIFDIYRYQQEQDKKKQFNLALRAWTWIALGMLTKGPVAAAIPFVVSFLWFASIRDLKTWAKAIINPLGWLILLAIIGPWLYMVYLEQGLGFFQGFIMDHNVSRFSDTMEGHGGNYFYYIFALPAIMLPLSGLLWLPIRKAKALAIRPFERLMLIWFVVVFILVSVSQTQLPHYVLYGITPLFVLFAKYRNVWGRANWLLIFPALYFVVQILLPEILAQSAANDKNLYRKEMMMTGEQVLDTFYMIAAGLGLLAVIVIAFNKRLLLWKKLVAVGLAQSVFTYLFFVPAAAHVQQGSIKDAALYAKTIDETFVAYAMHMPSFSVYREQITYRRKPQPGEMIYTKADRIDDLQQEFGADNIQILFRQGGIVLAKRLPTQPAVLPASNAPQ